MAILLALGLLQVTMIKPYFRDQRVSSIEYVASEIADDLLNKDKLLQADIEDTFNMILNNDMCAVIFNDNGRVIYEEDALGATCTFDRFTTIDGESFIPLVEPIKIIESVVDDQVLSTSIISDVSDQEMVLYGRMIEGDLANYYLFINSPVEPIESYIELFTGQYYIIAFVVFIAAIGTSFFLSKRITYPIVKIKNEASKLTNGDYDVDFDIDSYSEINDLANTLAKTGKVMETTDELRQDLIANISHDIKTPLTMIKAYSEMIRDISGDDKTKRDKHLNVIIEEADYLDRLVDDMRDVSKLQAGQQTLNRTNFDMKETIERIIEHYRGGILKDMSISVDTDLVSSVVWADETAISRVISNFLSNAIKYSFADSKIMVRMIDSEDRLRIEVIDDGKGISESELPYIWTRYYKIDKGFSRNINSTGLGLAIAKAILEAHGAKYGVISKVNVGSTFWFELSKDYDGLSKRD